MDPPKVIVLVVASILLIIAVLQYLITVQRDAKEPPYLYPKVPMVGHLIGMMTQGADYFQKLESRYHQSIYTLPILKGRMYLVTSPEWAQAIHKSYKSVHFNTLVAQAMKSLFLMDEDAMAILNQNLNNEDGTKTGVMNEIHDMVSSLDNSQSFISDKERSKHSETRTNLFLCGNRCSQPWLPGRT